MARRYDSSTTTFSPEGRLHQVRNNSSLCSTLVLENFARMMLSLDVFGCLCSRDFSTILCSKFLTFIITTVNIPVQVEYAIEAINNAGTCVGILAKDGIVMASERRITSGLLAPAKVSNADAFYWSDHVIIQAFWGQSEWPLWKDESFKCHFSYLFFFQSFVSLILCVTLSSAFLSSACFIPRTYPINLDIFPLDFGKDVPAVLARLL